MNVDVFTVAVRRWRLCSTGRRSKFQSHLLANGVNLSSGPPAQVPTQQHRRCPATTGTIPISAYLVTSMRTEEVRQRARHEPAAAGDVDHDLAHSSAEQVTIRRAAGP